MSKWISVKEQLPPSGVDVLVWVEGRGVERGWWCKNDIWDTWVVSDTSRWSDLVAYWQPFPDMPEEESDERGN